MLTAKELTFLRDRDYGQRYGFNDDAGDEFPCYCTRVAVKNTIKPGDIHEFIRIAAKRSKKGILVCSVTERDHFPKEWLAAAEEYEGATVTQTISRWHGDYKCWLICIPVK